MIIICHVEIAVNKWIWWAWGSMILFTVQSHFKLMAPPQLDLDWWLFINVCLKHPEMQHYTMQTMAAALFEGGVVSKKKTETDWTDSLKLPIYVVFRTCKRQLWSKRVSLMERGRKQRPQRNASNYEVGAAQPHRLHFEETPLWCGATAPPTVYLG